MLVGTFKNSRSVGRVGRRHFPAKKASGQKPGSLVRIQYAPPINIVMDPITSISRISSWFGSKRITSTYEYRHYEHGNPVTRVTHHVTAEIYNKRGRVEVEPNKGSNLDKRV